MAKLSKITGLIGLFMFILISFAYSIDETFTITTYYPSPYGVYNELRMYPHSLGTLTCGSNNEGTLLYDSTNHVLYLCSRDTAVPPTYSWQAVGGGTGGGGYWEYLTGSTDHIRNNNTGNVGVGFGTNDWPDGKLSVITSGADVPFVLDRYAPGSPTERFIRLRVANGTPTSRTNIGNGYYLGGLIFEGYYNTQYSTGARILAFINGTLTATSFPTDLSFHTASSGATFANEKMRLTSAGYLGIGTTAPAGKLDVVDSFYTETGRITIRPQDGTNEGGEIRLLPADSYSAWIIDNYQGRFRWHHDGLGYMTITSVGNVGIGAGVGDPTPGYKLDVIGALRCESLTQYSSRDYKQDIETLAPSDYRDILKKLEQTEIFRFRYKEAKENSKLRLGLIAEEAPEEIVSHEGKGIDLGEAVSFLMAAVKAQAEEIKGLKQEISRLK